VIAEIIVDTHLILWMLTAPEQLTPGERDVIANAGVRLLSVGSLWEIGILIGLGRIKNDPRLMEVPAGFRLLPVTSPHCKNFAALPRHHKDPFDRMLIAQAAVERVSLLTRDQAMLAYAGIAQIVRFPEA